MHFKFVQNRECEYFPCHKGIDEDEFNCLFCYCPLYALKEDCGGNYTYTKDGVKDCSACTLPHIKGKGYEHVSKHIKKVIELAKKE